MNMNLVNTVTMSLHEYEQLQATVKESKLAVIKISEGSEVTLSWSTLTGWMKTQFTIINPSDVTRELRRQIDALEEENMRLRVQIPKKRSLIDRWIYGNRYENRIR